MTAKKYKENLRRLEKNEPYNNYEKLHFNKQELAFIRGIQITRGMNKKDAMKHFMYSKRKNTDELKAISEDIREAYDSHDSPKIITFKPSLNKTKAKKPKRKKNEYIYKGVAKKVDEKTKKRFLSLKGTSRRYLDLKTGEEISRRERDRRLYLLLV